MQLKKHTGILKYIIDNEQIACLLITRKQALKWHPDRNRENVDEATEKFKLIAQVFHSLTFQTIFNFMHEYFRHMKF